MYNRKPYQNKVEKKPKIFASERLYSYALWLLNRRDYTVYEISQKMKKYQPDEKIIQDTVAKLVENGYINDERRATNLINSYIKKESSYKIKKRLADKGVSREVIQEVLEECVNEELESEVAQSLLIKKFKTYNPELKQKYASYLAGRGYNWDIISKAIEHLKRETDENE